MQTGLPFASPRRAARLAGALYVLIIILGAFAELVGRQSFVSAHDAAATARAILMREGVYRWGFAAEMATNVIAVPASLILWRLLAPVGRFWVLVALVLDLTQNAINAVNQATQYAPLTLLGGGRDLAAIPAGQLAALAQLALRQHDIGFDIGLTFFGAALLIYGAVIFRSRFLPAWLGLLYALAGGCYLVNSVDTFLALNLPIFPWILFGAFIGEAALALWLLIFAVDEAKWRAAAA
ncbi:MAG TPA: DUF4386 domain-containing protein [Caulobacteraceae bacterium]|nr:DUF4386 domain-containing protein [Caulobacteraceae bacterium]